MEQAEHNESTANNIKLNQPDWAITMCFYAALHWVERYGIIKGVNIEAKYQSIIGQSSLHEYRKLYVADIAYELGNKKLRGAYYDLEKESRKARYLKDLSSSAVLYYTRNKIYVTDSFQDLQIIKQLLKNPSS